MFNLKVNKNNNLKPAILKTVCRFSVFVGISILGFNNVVSAQIQTEGTEIAALDQSDTAYVEAMKLKVMGKFNDSYNLLQKYLVKNPTNAAANYEFAQALVRRNEVAKATTYAKKAVDLDPNNKWYFVYYGNLLANNKKYKEAAKQYFKAGKLVNDPSEYFMTASKLYEEANDYQNALNVLDSLQLYKSETNEDLLLAKQSIYVKLNDLGEAVKINEQIIKSNPLEPKYAIYLAYLYNTNGFPEMTDSIMTKLRQEFSYDEQVRIANAAFNMERKRWNEIELDLKEMVKDDTLTEHYLFSTFLKYYALKDKDSTIIGKTKDFFKNYSDQHPKNVLSNFYLSYTALYDKNYDDAEKYAVKLTNAYPNKDWSWNYLITAYLESQKVTEARAAIDAGIAKNPKSYVLHNFKMSDLYEQKKMDDVIATLLKMNQIAKDDDNFDQIIESTLVLGDTYNSLKNFTASDSCYDLVLKDAPTLPIALNNYSYSLLVRDIRMADAINMAKEAVEQEENNPSYLDTYGYALLKSNNFVESETYLLKALYLSESSSTSMEVLKHLQELYSKSGQKDKLKEVKNIIDKFK